MLFVPLSLSHLPPSLFLVQFGHVEMGEVFDAVPLELNKVLRSTQRLIAGSNMFRKDAGDMVAGHHSEGPPLTSFLFENTDGENLIEKYVSVVAERVRARSSTRSVENEQCTHLTKPAYHPTAAIRLSLLSSRSSPA